MAKNNVENNGGTCMTYVADIVCRDPADIHTDGAFPDWLQNFFFSCFRIK
jgi:hypothetical protein